MSNPFNLTDEQLKELDDAYHETRLARIKDVLAEAERMTIENAAATLRKRPEKDAL